MHGPSDGRGGRGHDDEDHVRVVYATDAARQEFLQRFTSQQPQDPGTLIGVGGWLDRWLGGCCLLGGGAAAITTATGRPRLHLTSSSLWCGVLRCVLRFNREARLAGQPDWAAMAPLPDTRLPQVGRAAR